jgi:hypothetical protein
MRRAFSLTALILILPLTAHAQEEFDRASKAPKSNEASGKDAAAPKDAGKGPGKAGTEVQANQGTQGRFLIRRGFFAEADLGMYMTFLGRNTNDPMLPSRFSSNLEPHIGVNVGYDVVQSEGFNLALALRFAMGFNGGLGRVTDAQFQASTNGAPAPGTPDAATKPADYTVTELGALIAASIMMTDRIALTIRGDGGIGILDPDPSKAAATLDTPMAMYLPGAGAAVFVPVFGAGVGVEYYTLLNDFSIGILLRFQGILAPDGLIPAMSITFPVKYTF